MTQSLQPITPDSQLLKTLTCIPEKFVVDFANGIDVAKDHLRVQRERSRFFSRCFDGFTGNSARRQNEINANLTNAVEGSLRWLTELSREVAASNYAIKRVNDRVTQLTTQMVTLAEYSEATRHQLGELAQELDQRIGHLNQEVARIDFNQKVIMHLDQVFHKWNAGRFMALSPAGRCYAAFEELRWGAFGDYCRSQTGIDRDNFMGQAVDRAIAQLVKDTEIAVHSRLGVDDGWLRLPRQSAQYHDWQEALGYLADEFDSNSAPFVTTITQKPTERLNTVPILASASRVAETIAEEVFSEELQYA